MRSNSWQCMTMEPILILFAPMNDSCCNQEWLLKESCDEIDKNKIASGRPANGFFFERNRVP